MARFLRLSDEDVELLFRGLAPEENEDLRDLGTFLVDAAESLSRPPRSEVEAGHLALLAEAIRSRAAEVQAEVQGSPRPIATRTRASAGSTERRGPMRHRTVRWAAKVAVAAASLVVLTAALAFAGVDLPGTAAETAFESVLGVDLPNQAEEAADAVDPEKLPPEASDTAVRVLTVIHEWYSGAPWTGCEFGARVSQAARGLEGEPDTSHCQAAESEPAGSEAAGSDDGDEGSEGAGGAADAAGGLETADEASDGEASQGAAEAEAGLGEADEASSGGAGGPDEGS